MDVQLPIEAKDIQKLIPHRYPFLQLDRITAFEPMKTLTAIKNVTINEPQFHNISRPARYARRTHHRSDGAGVRHVGDFERRRAQGKRIFLLRLR